MNKKTKDAIVRSIIRIVNNISESSKQGIRRTKIINRAGKTFALVDEFVDEYDGLVKRILQKEGWSEKYSERYLQDVIGELFVNILKEGTVQNTGQYFERIVTDYISFSQEQTCYVPLAGINIAMDALPFGKIILKKMTDALTEEVAQKIESIIMLGTNTEEQKIKAVKSLREKIETLHGTICAEFKIVAEQRRARERAEEETRRVIDLILYSIPALYQRELRVTAGLFGEVSSENRITPIIASDERRFTVDISAVGPLTNFDLTPGHIKHMERIGVFKVADILKKSDKILTNFESTILRGIHWFASSQSQYEQENEFLNLVTCLETFLTPTDRDPIANAVAEGVAMLISDDLESRKIIKKRIKYFYGIRSGISHGGQKTVLDVEIAELKKMTGTLIMRLIDRVGELESQRQLLEWIEDQRLGK